MAVWHQSKPQTPQLTWADTSPIVTGKVGLEGWDGGAGWSIDNFAAGDVGGAMPTATPTRTPPTSTPLPGSSTLLFTSIFLQGIGKAGDAVSPGTTGNQSPLTPQRPLTVQIINGAGQIVSTAMGAS